MTRTELRTRRNEVLGDLRAYESSDIPPDIVDRATIMELKQELWDLNYKLRMLGGCG